MASVKRLLIFFIVLIIVSIIEASIIFYASLEKPSQKTAINKKFVSLHLCYAKSTASKPKPKQELKPVKKPEPKPKPKLKPKPKPKPKQKLKPKMKPTLNPKPIQKKLVKQPSSTVQKSHLKSIQSAPKKSNPSAQKVDRAKMDAIKSAYLKEVRQLIEFNKYYPRRAKRMHRSGVVEIEFTILKNGKISNINILKGCKYSILNRAAKKTLEKIGAFKPLPNAFESDSLTLRIPINYILKH